MFGFRYYTYSHYFILKWLKLNIIDFQMRPLHLFCLHTWETRSPALREFHSDFGELETKHVFFRQKRQWQANCPHCNSTNNASKNKTTRLFIAIYFNNSQDAKPTLMSQQQQQHKQTFYSFVAAHQLDGVDFRKFLIFI